MKPPLPDAAYVDRKKAEFAAEHQAWHDERWEAIKGKGLDPSKDFECWTWEREHPDLPLPAWMAEWRVPKLGLEFENGSHAQSDSATDKQNARDDAEAMERVFARYRPTRVEGDPLPKKPRKKAVKA